MSDSLDCSMPGSSVHGTFKGRILEWLAISFSTGSSWPRDWTQVSCITGRFLTAEYWESPIIREMQVKTPMSCHLTLVRRPSSKGAQIINKCWRECGGKGTPLSFGGHEKWHIHSGKESGTFLKTTNQQLELGRMRTDIVFLSGRQSVLKLDCSDGLFTPFKYTKKC